MVQAVEWPRGERRVGWEWCVWGGLAFSMRIEALTCSDGGESRRTPGEMERNLMMCSGIFLMGAGMEGHAVA